MAAMNRNHAKYERRLNFIRREMPFSTRFNIENADITPIAYNAECPFDYNNFIYRLTLASAIYLEDNTKETLMQQQPGCKVIPDGMTQFITGFGGLTFDSAGRMVSGPMTSVGAGPWPSYEEQNKGRLLGALARADANPYIRGWHANGVRKRIDAFVDHGVPAHFRTLASKEEKVLTHADFTSNNMLYDAASNRITALLDYDFSCISHPSYDFFCSFSDVGGHFQGWSGDEDTEQVALHDAKLHGFPSRLPPSSEDRVDWELAKAWEDELEKAQVLRPLTIQGIEHVADVQELLGAIGPWPLSNLNVFEMQSEKVKIKLRDAAEKRLVKILDRFGF